MASGMMGQGIISGISSALIVILFGRHFILSIPKLFISANMNTLIGIGIVSAFILSIWNLYKGLVHEIYFESAAFIAAFVLLGQWIEHQIRDRMNKKMSELVSFLPQKVRKLDGANEFLVDPSELKPKDRIRVLVGERLGIDAKLLSASGTFDESIMTGESRPIEHLAGDEIVQGALNAGQPVELEVVRFSQESLYEVLSRDVQKTLKQKPEIQKRVDRMATFFVPLVVLLAIGAGVYWKLNRADSDLFFMTALSVLVIACPCALGLATPAALLVGVVRAGKRGILLKSLEAVEKASDVSVVAFDKTGTLTLGHPEVQRIRAIENFSHKDLLQLALSLEVTSEHPYAEAIRRKAKEEKVFLLPASDVQIVPGKGVIGTIKKSDKAERVCVGNLVWFYENGYDSTQIPQDLRWEADGTHETCLWVGSDRKFLGILFLADSLRPESKAVVSELNNEKYEVGMITGDAENVAKGIAKELKLKFVHAGVLPEEKATLVKRLSEPKKKGLDRVHSKVCFVGDGVNDAPALAQAHLGIAMGSATSISQATAAVILPAGGLAQVSEVFRILKSTRSLIQQNLLLSFGYNIIALPIAAGVLYPQFGFLLSPSLAAAAMALSSITVLLNSLRALRH